MATNSTEALDRAYAATAGTVDTISLHSADPGTTGASEVDSEPGGYGAPTAGAGDLDEAVTIAVPADTTVTHWGAWDGADFLFGAALVAPQPFATAGEYTLNTAPYSAANPS